MLPRNCKCVFNNLHTDGMCSLRLIIDLISFIRRVHLLARFVYSGNMFSDDDVSWLHRGTKARKIRSTVETLLERNLQM